MSPFSRKDANMSYLWRGSCPALILGLVVLSVAGCVPGTGTGKSVPPKKVETHPDRGPHGGPLAEWGEEEYHVEFTADRGKKEVAVFILDGSARKPAAIKAKTVTLTMKKEKPPVQVKLTADPQKDDAPDTASRFVGTHEKFAEELDPDEIDVSAEVNSKPYEGTFEVPGHKHGKK
jgi:hypothetical protein